MSRLQIEPYEALTTRGEITPEYYQPLEVIGIYWSFVDTVWVFLYPSIYLVGRS